MPYKLHFVEKSGDRPFYSYMVTGFAPNISAGDLVQLPVNGRPMGIRISSVLHRLPPNGDAETFYDCDPVKG